MKKRLFCMLSLLLALILVLCFTSCSSNKTFTVESINTKSAGFSGLSGSGLSSSQIYLEGKIGSKTYEIPLSKAFENYTVSNLSGEYESPNAWDPKIASLSLTLKDANNTMREITVSPGDRFNATVQDGTVVLLLAEE